MALSTTQYGYIIDPMVPFTDDKGKTIKNGFVRVFIAGSSTPVVTYRNFDGATNQDRIELDNSGRTKTSVIGSKGLTYKVCVYDQLHSQESPILTVDKVSVIGANITAGSGATVVTGLDGLTTKPDGFVDASVVGTDGYVALDHTLVEDDLDTDAKATTVENDRYIPLLNEDVNDPDSKMTLGRLWQWVLGKIKSLSTTITAFRQGDVIPVDGPDGPAKMTKDDLLKETAQNALAKTKWVKTLMNQAAFKQGSFDVNGRLEQFMPWDAGYDTWMAHRNPLNLTNVDLLCVCVNYENGAEVFIQSYTVTTDASYNDTLTKSTRYRYVVSSKQVLFIDVSNIQYARISLCSTGISPKCLVTIGAIMDGYASEPGDVKNYYEDVPNSDNINTSCIVDPSGSGDYTDIVSAYNDNRVSPNPAYIEINVKDATYAGLVVGSLWARGESMYHTILSDTDSSYPGATITAHTGIIENFTFYMDSPAEVSPAYALHVDSASAKNKKVVYKNCRFISTRQSAIGIGLASGQAMFFEDCEFLSHSEAAAFFHDARKSLGEGNYGGLQWITFTRCKFNSKGDYALKMLSVESSNILIATFIDCTFAADHSNQDCIRLSGVTTHGFLCGNSILLGSSSHGNNIDILNAV